MAKKHYTVTSPSGAAFAHAEEGDTVELELEHDTERAVVCAGWLAPAKTKKENS